MVDVRALSTAATALCVGVALAQDERAICVIDSHLAELIEELDHVEAAPDLRTSALRPLQTLETTVATGDCPVDGSQPGGRATIEASI
jgi:hypothetical protein